MKEFVIAIVLGVVFFGGLKIAIESSELVEKYWLSMLIFGPTIIAVALILLGFQFHY